MNTFILLNLLKMFSKFKGLDNLLKKERKIVLPQFFGN